MDPITVESVALLVVFALLSLGMKKVEHPVFRKYREWSYVLLDFTSRLSKSHFESRHVLYAFFLPVFRIRIRNLDPDPGGQK
jgi:hypothetical protein